MQVEGNGINVVADEERTGTPRQLFWPWFGANVSVLGLSYGAFAPGFGISLSWQGYLLGPFGGREGDWVYANLGVLVALLLGFVVWLLAGRSVVRAQERVAVSP